MHRNVHWRLFSGISEKTHTKQGFIAFELLVKSARFREFTRGVLKLSYSLKNNHFW